MCAGPNLVIPSFAQRRMHSRWCCCRGNGLLSNTRICFVVGCQTLCFNPSRAEVHSYNARAANRPALLTGVLCSWQLW